MKARLFKIVIAAEFNTDVDSDVLPELIMKALQTEGVPSGRAQVLTQPLDPVSLQPYPAPSVPRHLLN